MKKSITNGLAMIAAAFFFGGCATGKVSEGEKHSGFLKDYSQLKQEKDAAGDPVLRYVSPQLSSRQYRQIMIDPVEYYPPPQPNETVDSATLNEIRAYLDKELRRKIGERVPVVDKPGPSVLRMRAAITAVGGERATLAVYEYLPIGLAIAGATGGRVQEDREFRPGNELADRPPSPFAYTSACDALCSHVRTLCRP